MICISGLPKIAYQGCHISGGRKDTISKLMADDGQTINLNHHAFRFFWGILLESCILRPPVRMRPMKINGLMAPCQDGTNLH